MYRQIHKRIFTEVQVNRPRIQETRPVADIRGAGRERRGGRVHGRGSVRTVSFSASISGGRSRTVSEDNGNLSDVEREGISQRKRTTWRQCRRAQNLR